MDSPTNSLQIAQSKATTSDGGKEQRQKVHKINMMQFPFCYSTHPFEQLFCQPDNMLRFPTKSAEIGAYHFSHPNNSLNYAMPFSKYFLHCPIRAR